MSDMLQITVELPRARAREQTAFRLQELAYELIELSDDSSAASRWRGLGGRRCPVERCKLLDDRIAEDPSDSPSAAGRIPELERRCMRIDDDRAALGGSPARACEL
jgi:hypothetical protein